MLIAYLIWLLVRLIPKTEQRIYVLYGIAGWYALSLFFFLFPTILCKRKSKLKIKGLLELNQPIYHSSHRGGSLEATENTLEAFEYAMRMGTDIIETDVQMTKDEKIIVCHDDTFKRVCEGSEDKVINTLSTELPRFKKRMMANFRDWYERPEGSQDSFNTLEEVFEKIPREQVIHLEIKNKKGTRAT